MLDELYFTDFQKKNHFWSNNVNQYLHIIYSYNQMQKVFGVEKLINQAKSDKTKNFYICFCVYFEH